MSSDEIKDLKNYFSEWDKILLKNNDIFFFYHWATFVDENNFPASKPPWGEIVAMNIKTGKIIWKTKIGKLSPSWSKVLVRNDGYAHALLQGHWGELLFNALKYTNYEKD